MYLVVGILFYYILNLLNFYEFSLHLSLSLPLSLSLSLFLPSLLPSLPSFLSLPSFPPLFPPSLLPSPLSSFPPSFLPPSYLPSLPKELALLRKWIDEDPRLCHAEILLAMLLTYRDVQAYNLMVDLVEKLPEHEQVLKAPVQMQYAFALNRRNQSGDRDKALDILEKVITGATL